MASLKQRGSIYYIQYYLSGQQRRVSTDTDDWQIAKEKLRQFESAQMRGDLNPLPTKTPIGDVVTAYVDHMRTTKTAKSAQTDTFTVSRARARKKMSFARAREIPKNVSPALLPRTGYPMPRGTRQVRTRAD